MPLRSLLGAMVDRFRTRPNCAVAAETRGRALLLRLLDPSQRRDFERHGYFSVQVAGRGTFWILPSTFFNVLHAETGDCYCAVPRAEVPLSDLMLGQKLLLEHEPKAFFRIANRRAELTPDPSDPESGPDRVMQKRNMPPPDRIRWSEVSMIPHANLFS